MTATGLPACTREPATRDTPLVLEAGRFFTQEEMTLVGNIADLMMPDTETPGALSVGVPGVLDIILAKHSDGDEQASWRAGLSELQNELGNADDQFNQMARWLQLEKLAEFDSDAFGGFFGAVKSILGRSDKVAEQYKFYRELKETILKAYYFSQEGASEELRYALVPGQWEPCVAYQEGAPAWFNTQG